MLIIGAGGLAKELLAVLTMNNDAADLCFFDDINEDAPAFLYGKFPVIKSWDEAREHFQNRSPEFALGVGDPLVRMNLSEKARSMGGRLSSIISQQAFVGGFGNSIGPGVCVLPFANLTCDIALGEGSLVNKSAIISHEVKVGRYCGISPGASVLGRGSIGDCTNIGAHAVILPGVKVGSFCTIGAGAVVIKDVPDNSVFAGVPAKPITKTSS